MLIKRKDIPSLFTPEIRQAVYYWQKYKHFGLPDSRGWTHNSAVLVDYVQAVIEAVEEIRAANGGN